MKRVCKFLILFLIGMVFFACNAEVKISVQATSDGVVDLGVQLDPILVQYILDLQSAFTTVSPQEAEQLLDPSKTKDILEKSDTVRVVSMDSSSKNKIAMKLAFKPLEQVLDEGNRLIEKDVQQKIRNVMDLSVDKAGVKTAVFHLDKDNFNSLVKVLPPEIQPLLALFSPPGYSVDREEYLDVLKLNFIEYDAEHIGEQILKSKLKLDVTFGGQLISATGGRINGKNLKVEVPLMDLLLLDKPFEFQVKFK